MKFLSLILLLMCGQVFAASGSGNTNNVFQGSSASSPSFPGLTLPIGSLSSLKTLSAANNAGSHSDVNFYVLYSGDAAGAYQVSAIKPAVCTGFYYVGSNTSIIAGVQFGYGTAAATDDSASAPTGVVYLNSAKIAAASPTNGIPVPIVGADVSVYVPFKLTFPVSTYPFVRVANSAANFGVVVSCIEQ